LKTEIDKLQAEEEQAGLERDYERAAQKKAERLRLEQEYTGKRDKWEVEHQLDEVVDVDDIAAVVHQWTGIPVTQMLETESEKLLHMEARLHERIIGQEEAIHAISDAIRRARSGLKDPARPIGSFIFIGPSGLARPNWQKPSPGSCSMTKKRSCALICLSIANSTRSAVSSARLPDTLAMKKAVNLPKPCAAVRIAWCFSMRSKRRIPKCGMPCCKFWMTAV
jgi:hypothetical protein